MITNLPYLPIHEETKNISQDIADRIFDCLIKSYPEKISDIKKRNIGSDAHPVDIEESYFRVIKFVFDNSQEFPFFDKNELSLIDLMFELWRRVCVASKVREPKIRGKPLAPSVQGPFPERLSSKPVSEQTEASGLTQADADYFIDQYYSKNKLWSYIQGEAWRRNLVIFRLSSFEGVQFFDFAEIFPEMCAGSDWNKRMQCLRAEAADRIRISCDYYSKEEMFNFFKIKPI